MNSLERVRMVLERKIPDSVPRALYDVAIDTYNQSTLDLFAQKLGKHPRDAFRQDLRGLVLPYADEGEEWYRVIRAIRNVDDVHRIMKSWSKPTFDINRLKNKVRQIHQTGYPVILVGQVSDFETPFSLRGRE